MAEKKIERKDWLAQFTLVGKPIVNDFTFEIDKHSTKSSYVYSRMRLGVDCGEKHGTVYGEMMGGYSLDNPYPLRKPTKNEDGSANFDEMMVIEWDDRNKDEIVEQVHRMSLITVGLEKTNDGKTYYRDFLTEYDAIEYIKEHLTSDMTVNVKGNLQYSVYNGVTQVRKNITSIALSSKEPSDYKATFTQTVLLDIDSTKLTSEYVDKDKGVLYINGRVLDYVKEYNGVEVRGQFPYNMRFEFDISKLDESKLKKVYDNYLKVKKHVTQETFEGDFVESGAKIQPTMDDVPDDIKELIELGLTSEEDVLEKMSSNGSKERRMVLKKPYFKLVGDDKKPVVQKFEERFEEDDLILDCMTKNADNDTVPWEEEESGSGDGDDMSWLDNL